MARSFTSPSKVPVKGIVLLRVFIPEPDGGPFSGDEGEGEVEFTKVADSPTERQVSEWAKWAVRTVGVRAKVLDYSVSDTTNEWDGAVWKTITVTVF